MRVVSALACFLFLASGCAAPGAGSTANGWARPARGATDAPVRSGGGSVQVVDREDRPMRDDARRTPVASGDAPGLAAGMMIPVEGIEVNELKDSFHAGRSGGRTHNAIDIAAPTGTPIVAVVDGTIKRKHWNSLGGRTLYLRSADGQHDFYYAHLDAYADDLEIGTVVRRGDVIGTVGSTGNARGPHLHFQVLRLTGSGRGTPVNPYDVLTRSPLYAGR